ncbi:MAG: F420-dependent oxidoreductase [Phycisphaerae bacterium]|nr:F420-dependent oxidoreductase [Phycisphaerae bacterium]NIP53322.1 F420-dependent oxidoreductase [Phycisphaerae bacterium]NIS49957.1 F420-dependent oxidoreductase [Phycisphaerae bacterium]NIU07661.1 F420-dependent oxidoreductase [Phycisphaerae bacterium]NIU57526.1 F420-dependent oxidoreductase [Phycisphaerae bacterium]
MKRIEILGLQTIPEIREGDNLAEIVVKCSKEEIGGLQDKDIVVLTSKIVSKASGRMRKLDDVKPGKKARAISRRTGKDAKWLQMIFDEGHEIVTILPIKGVIERYILSTSHDAQCTQDLCDHEQAVCITRSKDGRIHTCDAGIDGSNHPAGMVSLLPEDPDAEAKRIREQIQNLVDRQVAVILADTEMIPFGTMDFAVGSSGIGPISKNFGRKDLFGKPKFGGIDLLAYEMTSASALLFGQTGAGIPVVVIRGCEYEINETENVANTLLPRAGDAELGKAVKATMRATSYAKGLKGRLLLQIASWFM